MSIDDVSSNVVSDVSVLRVAGDGGGGESEEVVIKDELFGRPDIFLTYPSPLGWNDGERALWGVNVANPTDQPIYVSRVVIVALKVTVSPSVIPVIFPIIFAGFAVPTAVERKTLGNATLSSTIVVI